MMNEVNYYIFYEKNSAYCILYINSKDDSALLTDFVAPYELRFFVIIQKKYFVFVWIQFKYPKC